MTQARDLPILGSCSLLLFLACSGCAAGAAKDAIPTSTAATHCFVLPGAASEATKWYRVLEGGGLEEAGEVSGGAMHMRAAFHPDGRTLYVSSAGPAGLSERFALGDSWEGGIHVRAYAYDPADCSIGRLLGTGRMGGEEPDNNRVYGLEVHPNGRWLYQTTSSLRRIRLFDLPEDRVPVPRYAFDVTPGGAHVCIQLRRLSMHPSGRYLYANCNNGDGLEDALQAWAIEPDGSITLLDHYTFPAMDGGVYDPVIHPSGDWLYQPVGTTSPDAPAGSGAYVLVYRVDHDGRLALRERVAVRTATAADSVKDPTSVMIQPSTAVLHPDGSTLYITLGVILAIPAPEPEDFAHEFAIYRVEDGGARLVERARMPALRETAFSTHGGATLAALGGELFLYSYLTDYDTIQGGVLQRLRITEDQSLEPLDPPWVSTGLFDGRQPIAMPGKGRAAEVRPERTGGSGAHQGAGATTARAGEHTCLVLPGSWSNATRSFAIGAGVELGRLTYASEVSGGVWHQRAAVHPTGRHAYVAAWVEDGDPARHGLYVFVHRLDPGSCELGPLLQVVTPQADTALDAPAVPPSPTRRRYYGLEMHPSGRFLYQTTEAWREIRFFRVGDDGLLTFAEAYDVTRGGEHVCDHARRLEIHPDGRTLYSNCNNNAAGDGVDNALQAWRIGDDGRLTFLEHQTTAGMEAGVFDPTVHPNGRWLYQPLESRKATAAGGPGAYVLIYDVAPDGRLRYHSALRVADPDADAACARAGGQIDLAVSPTTVLVHPDGTHAYVTLHDRMSFTHHLVAYRIDPANGELAHVYTTDTATRGTGTHHGAVLATRGGRTFLYTFVSTRAGAGPNPRGFLEQYQIAADYRPVRLQPTTVPTGLVDARHPVVVAEAPAVPSGSSAHEPALLIHPDPMVSPSPDGRLLAHVDWSTGDLAVRDLASGELVRVTANPGPYEDGFANSPRFAPDGERVAFTWWDAATGRAELRVVSIDPAALEAMGAPRTIRRVDYGWIEANGWTPDGARIVAWTLSEGGDNRIVLVSADDGRTEVARSFEWRVPLSVHSHPGGRYLAFDYQTSADDFRRDIRLLELEEDREIEVVTHPANDHMLGWSPDGRHLVFASDRSGSMDIWTLPFERGEAAAPPRLIREGLGPVAPVEITASGHLFYAASTGGQDVFFAPVDAETGTVAVPAEPVTEPDGAERLAPDWSPDGKRLAWVHNVGPRPRATGHQAIAIRTLETGETRLISLAPRLSHLGTPRWIDPDRLVLAARDEPSNTVRLYALDARTGEASLLVQPDSGAAIEEPVPGPRGGTLYYKENRENPEGERVQRVVRRDLRNGEEATLFSATSGEGVGWRLQRLALSPDGDRLALTLQQRGAAERLVVVPARGGPSERVTGFPGGGHVTLAWSADGRTIWFTRRADGADDEPRWELWWIDPQSGEHAAAGLVEEGLAGLTFDPTGTRIGFTAGRRSYEIRAIPLRPDPDFDPAVDEPAYQTDGPRVLFDEAHHNIHTSTGSYSPFVELIRHDGYRVTANREPFTRPVLDPYDVLVIASARGGPPRSEETAQPAFTDAENAAVRQWVRDGGSLLLITDHTPNAGAAAGLAAEFGVHIADATTLDTIRYHGGRVGGIVFARGHGTLRDHPVTAGRGAHERIERVVTFGGSSLAGPDGSHLLVLSPSALDRFWADSRGDTSVAVMRSAAGRAQAVAFPFGRGRVAVMGEAGAFTSVSVGGRQVRGMDEPGFDNRRLVLNTMHWLSGLLPATAEPRPYADPAFDPTVEEPAFVDETASPRALFDEAHFNTYTADARYRPFVDLIRSDGIRVDRGVEPLTNRLLADYDVLIVAGPRAADARCEWTQWTTVERCAAARPAFDENELDAIEAWVREGGGPVPGGSRRARTGRALRRRVLGRTDHGSGARRAGHLAGVDPFQP